MDVFKKQSTQKISNQKMKLKERDKSLLEYVQCMYDNVHAYKVPGLQREKETERERERETESGKESDINYSKRRSSKRLKE